MMMRQKLVVVGAGNVGATLAQRAAEAELFKQVVLIDIAEGIPQGKALDILQSGPVYGYDTYVVGANDYDLAQDADVVVITAGVARKPGMSRDDLLDINAKVLQGVCEQIKVKAPNSIVIVVSNPLDAMCHVAYATLGFPKERVLGMAGVLDTARFRTFIAQHLNACVEDVQAFVLGGHGDSMVPLTRYTSVAGIPVETLIDKPALEAIVQRARVGGAEIVGYLKTGSAFYAPSASVIAMLESIVKDKKRILPSSALLEGEFGVEGLYVGVPCKLGAKGLEQIMTITLTEEENAMLQVSINDVSSLVSTLKKTGYVK
jgi:malate dehydrogenase